MKKPLRDISDSEFECAVKEYDGLINYLANKYGIRGYDRDDLKQEFMMLLYKCLRYYNEDNGAIFTTYFTTAVHRWMNTNLIRMEHKLEVTSFDSVDITFDIFQCDEDVEFNVLIQGMAECIIEEVKTVRYGDLVLDVLYGNMTLSQASDASGVSKQRIQQLCSKVKDKLKEKLKEDIDYYDKIRITR